MSSPEVRRNIMFLSLCVALSASAMSLIFTVAAVIGYSLATDKSLSTLPVAFMMIAMMVPSAAPTILFYTTLVRKNNKVDHPFAAASVFLFGYLMVWGGILMIWDGLDKI